jgi:hypothetical protein
MHIKPICKIKINLAIRSLFFFHPVITTFDTSAINVVAQFAEELRYSPATHRFDSRGCYFVFFTELILLAALRP